MGIYLAVCFLLAVILGGAYYAYRISFYAPLEGRDKVPETKGKQYDPYRKEMARIFRQLNDRPCEFVTVQSRDGLTLSGRYYHIQDGAPLAICFHGYRSSPMTDFSGGSELCFQLGQNVLLVDQRAHGKSQGRTICFGIKERQDLVCWVDWALNRFGNEVKILLYGISMGGATVLMASGLPLAENVKCIVADCPYDSPGDIILTVGKQLGYPPKLIWPFVILGAKIYGGFDIRETTATAAVKNSKIPILIIHGEEDRLVPCEMSSRIADANPEMVTRVTVPGADHGLSFLEAPDTYRSAVINFLNKIL